MQEEKMIPFLTYEIEQAKHERTVRRLLIILMITIALIFASNAIWLYAWMRYDYSSSETVSIDSKDGVATYVGRDGGVIYGKDSSHKEADKN